MAEPESIDLPRTVEERTSITEFGQSEFPDDADTSSHSEGSLEPQEVEARKRQERDTLFNLAPSAGLKKRKCLEIAQRGDFDPDFHIIDPHTHLILLQRIECIVLRNSEFFSCEIQEHMVWTFDSPEMPAEEPIDSTQDSVQGLIVLDRWPKSQVRLLRDQNEMEYMAGALKSLFRSFKRVRVKIYKMSQEDLCKTSISILVERRRMAHRHVRSMLPRKSSARQSFLECEVDLCRFDAAELRPIDVARVKHLYEETYQIGPGDWNSTSCEKASHIYQICLSLMECLGLASTVPLAPDSRNWLSLLRKTALFLDVAIVSYMSSHTSRFDLGHPLHSLETLQVYDEHQLAFTFSKRRLACLNDFLDNRAVWVFKFFNDSKAMRLSRPLDREIPILATMKDFADVWGPIWATKFPDGRIKNYRVSKGVIHRATAAFNSFPVKCHFTSLGRYNDCHASNLREGEDLGLDENDKLLIGTDLKANPECPYAMIEFASDMKDEIKPLGTRPEEWKQEGRSTAIGVSKFLSFTQIGTQKLSPATALKQLILDKWTLNPCRANPTILSHLLGVEVSHCTGNARRVPLKYFLLCQPFHAILEQRYPGWRDTEWGQSLIEAVRSKDNDLIVSTWKTYVNDRKKLADVVCTILEILDETGRRSETWCNAAFLWRGEECSIDMDIKSNDWSTALRDTHLSASYVLYNEICLSYDNSQHGVSVCGDNQVSYTVLQTHLNLPGSKPASRYFFGPKNDRLVRCESGEDLLLTLRHTRGPRVSLVGSWFYQDDGVLREMLVPWLNESDVVIFIRSSTKSYHGVDIKASRRWRRIQGRRGERVQVPNSWPISHALSSQTRKELRIREFVDFGIASS